MHIYFKLFFFFFFFKQQIKTDLFFCLAKKFLRDDNICVSTHGTKVNLLENFNSFFLVTENILICGFFRTEPVICFRGLVIFFPESFSSPNVLIRDPAIQFYHVIVLQLCKYSSNLLIVMHVFVKYFS